MKSIGKGTGRELWIRDDTPRDASLDVFAAKTAARGLSQRGNAQRRGAASTASVGEPDPGVGLADA